MTVGVVLSPPAPTVLQPRTWVEPTRSMRWIGVPPSTALVVFVQRSGRGTIFFEFLGSTCQSLHQALTSRTVGTDPLPELKAYFLDFFTLAPIRVVPFGGGGGWIGLDGIYLLFAARMTLFFANTEMFWYQTPLSSGWYACWTAVMWKRCRSLMARPVSCSPPVPIFFKPRLIHWFNIAWSFDIHLKYLSYRFPLMHKESTDFCPRMIVHSKWLKLRRKITAGLSDLSFFCNEHNWWCMRHYYSPFKPQAMAELILRQGPPQ